MDARVEFTTGNTFQAPGGERDEIKRLRDQLRPAASDGLDHPKRALDRQTRPAAGETAGNAKFTNASQLGFDDFRTVHVVSPMPQLLDRGVAVVPVAVAANRFLHLLQQRVQPLRLLLEGFRRFRRRNRRQFRLFICDCRLCRFDTNIQRDRRIFVNGNQQRVRVASKSVMPIPGDDLRRVSQCALTFKRRSVFGAPLTPASSCARAPSRSFHLQTSKIEDDLPRRYVVPLRYFVPRALSAAPTFEPGRHRRVTFYHPSKSEGAAIWARV